MSLRLLSLCSALLSQPLTHTVRFAGRLFKVPKSPKGKKKTKLVDCDSQVQ